MSDSLLNKQAERYDGSIVLNTSPNFTNFPIGNNGLGPIKAKSTPAHTILNNAAAHLEERAAAYDKPQGERSFAATVEAFNAITGHTLTEEQGCMFMILLKAVRSQQGSVKLDSYEDGAAYFALAAEIAQGTRS